MKAKVRQMIFELPVTKTLQKQILSDKRRAFNAGEKIELRFVNYGSYG